MSSSNKPSLSPSNIVNSLTILSEGVDGAVWDDPAQGLVTVNWGRTSHHFTPEEFDEFSRMVSLATSRRHNRTTEHESNGRIVQFPNNN